MTVGAGSTIDVGTAARKNYTQSGGTTTVNGTLAAASTAISGGMLNGTGMINGPVTVSGTGTVQPGDAPGTLTVTGNYTQTAGTFSEQIQSAGTFGALQVGGNTSLGASSQLGITLLNGFNPVGNLFTILNDPGGTVSGTFANAPSSGFALDGVNWTIAYNPTDVILDAQSLVGSGAVTATWSTGSGNWTTASEWSCSPTVTTCIPNNNQTNTFDRCSTRRGTC